MSESDHVTAAEIAIAIHDVEHQFDVLVTQRAAEREEVVRLKAINKELLAALKHLATITHAAPCICAAHEAARAVIRKADQP